MTQQIFRVVTTRSTQVPGPDGQAVDVPTGATVNRVMVEPGQTWTPPEGTELKPDDGTPIWTPPAAKPMEMDSYAWLQRMPPAVQVSVASAAQKDPRLLVGMTLLGAAGTVNLNDPTGMLHNFLSIAVAATAGMSDPLTPELMAQMLRP